MLSIQSPQCDGQWHPFVERSFGQFGFFRAGPATVEVTHTSCTDQMTCSVVGSWTQEVLLLPER